MNIISVNSGKINNFISWSCSHMLENSIVMIKVKYKMEPDNSDKAKNREVINIETEQ